MRKPRRFRGRRGIYLIPTMFTVGNLFCGYVSIVQSSLGQLELAAILIIVAAVLDGLDGRIARLTGTTTEFGLEFDSLADLVSFGVAPTLLAYHWALRPLGRVGWVLAFIYVVCAATRLARFNLSGPIEDKRHFAGLPSPMAGLCIACAVFAFPRVPESIWLALVLAVVVAAIAVLMVSRLRYRSFREVNLRDRHSYLYVVLVAGMLVAIALHPELVLLMLCTGYALSGPVLYLLGLARRTEPGADPGPEVVDEPAVR